MVSQKLRGDCGSSKPLKKVSFFNDIIDQFLFIYLRNRSKKNRTKNYPKLACLPDDFIGHHIVSTGLYEEHLLLALFKNLFKPYHKDFSDQAALDIGANIGNHSCFFSEYFYSIISFEPNETAYAMLMANIRLNYADNITAMNYGLSSKDDDLSFVENLHGNLGASRFCENHQDLEGIRKVLPVKKGDSVVETEFPNVEIGLIKIDVEGHELDALRGLQDTIKKFHPLILFESNTSEGKNGGADIFNYLRSLEYCHFYSIEKKQNKSKFKIFKIIERLYNGYHIYAKSIPKPEDRSYSLIVASTVELLAD